VNRAYGDLLYRRLIGDYSDPLYSALDDLGTEDPARVLYSSYTYLRDQSVRAAVLRRAAGRCEYCGEEGFLKIEGGHYLETHHIIALAKDGADKVTNVIALCANDHRKAHFSDKRDSIEREMLSKLRVLNSSS
jgi:5-methylcytosine-specific restriction endonuclease McrA